VGRGGRAPAGRGRAAARGGGRGAGGGAATTVGGGAGEATGAGRVTRSREWSDVGGALNPSNVEGQSEGGAMMGLGLGILENCYPYYPSVEHRGAAFGSYLAPSMEDMPQLDTIMIENPSADGPYGAKGIGEMANNPQPPAIAAAVHDAIGLWIPELPIPPEPVDVHEVDIAGDLDTAVLDHGVGPAGAQVMAEPRETQLLVRAPFIGPVHAGVALHESGKLARSLLDEAEIGIAGAGFLVAFFVGGGPGAAEAQVDMLEHRGADRVQAGLRPVPGPEAIEGMQGWQINGIDAVVGRFAGAEVGEEQRLARAPVRGQPLLEPGQVLAPVERAIHQVLVPFSGTAHDRAEVGEVVRLNGRGDFGVPAQQTGEDRGCHA